MSFTEQVKNELARIPREDAGSRAAELLALLRMSGSFITGAHASWGLEFSTGNSAVARRVLVYLKKDFGFMPSTMVRQGRRLRKKNVYTLLVQPSKEGLHFLDTMGLSPLSGAEDMEKLVTAEERRAYLAGAFLGGGSVSRPQSDYHLEMVTQSARFAEEIVKAMKSFRLNARLTDRKNDYIVYIKDGDEVSEFLQIVGAAHGSRRRWESLCALHGRGAEDCGHRLLGTGACAYEKDALDEALYRLPGQYAGAGCHGDRAPWLLPGRCGGLWYSDVEVHRDGCDTLDGHGHRYRPFLDRG